MYNLSYEEEKFYQEEEFEHGLTLMTDLLQLQEQELIRDCQKILSLILGADYAQDILIAAAVELAERDSESFHWALQTFEELKEHLKITQRAATLAAMHLIRRGHIPGQAFSVTHTGKILLTLPAKATLRAILPLSDRQFIQDFLQISE